MADSACSSGSSESEWAYGSALMEVAAALDEDEVAIARAKKAATRSFFSGFHAARLGLVQERGCACVSLLGARPPQLAAPEMRARWGGSVAQVELATRDFQGKVLSALRKVVFGAE